ncbi:Metallo-hydrolase/oxidoreductase superfamily protein isoform 2 [Hibiscus syriacus]|uniref:Metallo-hydrolase/oxidoreductase superfamily protein isoform 2 n=1 Tax=Hibiscus syriacus TaxID=106335 RepID=A0A6A3AD86_HIBSY|nr:Metallo-hydrolase/oxidoreductase superfamily protein isoform 2 [Hibiscus syriacus]
MAVHCNSAPLCCKPLRNRGPRPGVSAVVSKESVVGSNSSGTDVFNLTYLEGNSWLWDVSGVKLLVDPILVGNLDFGIPLLYDAAKKFIRNFKLSDLPQVDCLLITQNLDDDFHLRTIKPLSEMSPNLRVVSTPNDKPLLDPLFRNVTYLEPGQESEVEPSNGSKVRIQATPGPVLSPPWQLPENGARMMKNQIGWISSRQLIIQMTKDGQHLRHKQNM